MIKTSLLLTAALLLSGCERPPIETVQTGYRGTGMEQIYNPRTLAKQASLNAAPVAAEAASADGPKARDVYQNVKVLGDLSVAQFTQLMVNMTNWVAPTEGCAYCHNPANFAEEGKYELRVKALDRSANKSGAGDGTAEYRIQFEVVLKSSITEVLNWPNPFTTSTQFVFTLTGSELPSDFRIDIMNITGKIVKEITLQDIGSINIGRNISEYKWDGTDNFGDPLGNGVYLYRVTAKINGEDIESREVSISTTSGPSTLEKQYFKHGWGKLYIMR